MGDLGKQVIALVTIRHQSSGKALQKSLRPLSATIRLVLKETYLVPDQCSAGVQPHPGFQGRGLSILLQYLHNGFIRVNHGMGQKLLLHVLVQRLQPTLTALDHPVCHSCAAEGNSFSGPDLFLPG